MEIHLKLFHFKKYKAKLTQITAIKIVLVDIK